MTPNKNVLSNPVTRLRVLYGLLLVVVAIFAIRLFYLQVINHQHYKAAALSDQLKQYSIPATRGNIEAYDGNNVLPLVLNHKLYLLYADPVHVKDADKAAVKIGATIGGDASKYAQLMKSKKTRYVVLAKKLTPEQNTALNSLKLPGVGTQVQNFRTYPQGTLGAQLLGFVNDEGKGKYGIEQSLDKHLKGTPGQLEAITDARGVPLAASKNNTRIPPKHGQKVVLTIDLAIQQQLENILAEGVKKTKAPGASAVIIDPRNGAIKAMANMPTYDPSKYFEVEDAALFQNNAVSHPIEVGSSMKTLTTAAALDQGVIRADQTYHDPASWTIDEFKITNIEETGGPATRSVTDILNKSLNTGATWELMQMGGGEVNQKAREAWYDYLSNRYMFGKPTGVEQGYEAPGTVPEPADNGAGINLTYANTAFGQAMTATPIQMSAALSAAVNGGTYYQPRLVDRTIGSDGRQTTVHKPKPVKQGVVSSKTSGELISMMRYIIDHRNLKPPFDQSAYMVGGKTGTAQIAKPGGGYYDDQFNGTYVGFVGGETPQYVAVVYVYKPTIGGYAGSAAAQPIFVDLARMLINNSHVTPRQP